MGVCQHTVFILSPPSSPSPLQGEEMLCLAVNDSAPTLRLGDLLQLLLFLIARYLLFDFLRFAAQAFNKTQFLYLLISITQCRRVATRKCRS